MEDELTSELLDGGQLLHASDCFSLHQESRLMLVVDNVSHLATVTRMDGRELFQLCRIIIAPDDFAGLMLPLYPPIPRHLMAGFRTWAALATSWGRPQPIVIVGDQISFAGGASCALVLA